MIAPLANKARASVCFPVLLLSCLSCRGAFGFRAEKGVQRATTQQDRRSQWHSSSSRCPPLLPASRFTTSRRFLVKLNENPVRSQSKTPAPSSSPPSPGTESAAEDAITPMEEARRFLEQASELRKQAEEASELLSQKQSSRRTAAATETNTSPFALPPPTAQGAEGAASTSCDYRLHVDVGREPGSWMEPRWGASGRRIEFTLDVRFTGHGAAGEGTTLHASSSLVGDGTSLGWLGSKASDASCYSLETAPYARMRSGFDRMACLGGLYRIEKDKKNGDGMVRFCIQVDGTTDYGDVTIPPGYLYFSIPAFSSKLSLLSRKPGPVTVRQPGWNTGWRREESRIVGVFVATPLADKSS